VQAFGRRMMACCRQYADLERRLPADRVVTVRYPDLVADPVAAVERVYDHLGLRPSSAFRRRLVDEARRARSHRSTHRYRLEDFGLSRRDVDRELGDLIARYSLDTSARAIRSSRMRSTRRA
ncbi:MAG: sulfotransferase, partial [Myxococcota bacterium]